MEFAGVPAELLGTLAPSGIVTLFVVALLTGRLVPKSIADDVRAVATQRVAEAQAEREVWREAYNKSQDTVAAYAEQAHTSVELAEGLSKLLERVAPELRRGEP